VAYFSSTNFNIKRVVWGFEISPQTSTPHQQQSLSLDSENENSPPQVTEITLASAPQIRPSDEARLRNLQLQNNPFFGMFNISAG